LLGGQVTKLKPSIIVEPTEVITTFARSDAELFSKKWLSAYGKNRLGLNTKAFMWHVFSGGGHPAVSGQEALSLYREHVAAEYIVLSNDRAMAISSAAKPDSCNLPDYYVFPPNLAWTVAITHEDGWLGPYFATHRDYKLLNQENVTKYQARLLKAEQLALAKSKGWV
jgi:hypothetical protein